MNLSGAPDLNLEDLKKRQVVLGDVVFEFGKMEALEAWALYETVRPELKDAITGLDLPSVADGVRVMDMAVTSMVAILQAVCGVPGETLLTLRNGLFMHVHFVDPTSKARKRLAGNEDDAFADLEAVHVYEVLVRAFYVNFSGSLSVIQSRYLSGKAPLASALSLLGISIRSSDTS